MVKSGICDDFDHWILSTATLDPECERVQSQAMLAIPNAVRDVPQGTPGRSYPSQPPSLSIVYSSPLMASAFVCSSFSL